MAIADATLDALEAAGIATVPDDGTPARLRRRRLARPAGAARASTDRDVLLDGAHNPAGAAALAIALDDLRPFLAAGPLTLVTASMADKDVDGVIAALARVGGDGRCDRRVHEPRRPARDARRRSRDALAGDRRGLG